MTAAALRELCDSVGYTFRDPNLLEQALTHRSWCAENDGVESNERLEFLGDSVLGIVVTDFIYREYPNLNEGELAKLRAAVVSAVSLAGAARRLQLGECLRLGKGERSSGGSDKSSILADALEAVIGAVYIDGGIGPATTLVVDLLGNPIAEGAKVPGLDDFKTRLQERVARTHETLPRYVIDEEGPDHEKRFFAEVVIDGTPFGRGEGRSKKEAEQAAAAEAWEQVASLEPDGEPDEADTSVDVETAQGVDA